MKYLTLSAVIAAGLLSISFEANAYDIVVGARPGYVGEATDFKGNKHYFDVNGNYRGANSRGLNAAGTHAATVTGGDAVRAYGISPRANLETSSIGRYGIYY